MKNRNNLLDFKRNAIMLGLCAEYKEEWDSCRTKEDLVKLATDSNGIAFLADSFSFGWGVSVDYLLKEFKDYISDWTENKPIRHSKNGLGYTSEIYVTDTSVVTPRGTLNIFIDCHGVIQLPEGFVGSIYICGGSSVIVCGKNLLLDLYVYGTDIVIIDDDVTGKINRTNIEKSQWVK